MEIHLVPGDYLIDESGHHVCCKDGYAVICTKATVVTVPDRANYSRIWPIIQHERVARGVNPDGTVPAKEG